ncbi:lipid-A-disaccharide synthase [Oceanibacterium hippocampi]|uniref:Lipid-A-disaccharide synthase n=1 Tax=Oceanibacterium hippocampi TaxID=745714 RepID=A0A1Y5T2U0_9PROT|nr:lipid-A-disaccharide synthase [Oceanibacterium hippocampi]SLN54140.1 Lipid-A-disaccharide synthase [Oceanibacterium hippocampi]
MGRPLRLMLVAGEHSGDALGAALMAAIARRSDRAVEFSGLGGPQMIAAGLDSLAPMDDLAVMGFVDVFPKLAKILRHLRTLRRHAGRHRPDAVVTIDAPAFCNRLARQIRPLGLTQIHYVAPSVWAWKPERARKIARTYDHLLTLLPFEPPWFEREGLAASFIGHPAVEWGIEQGDGPRFRAAHGIAPDAPLLALLPGSRVAEVSRHLPVFLETVAALRRARPGLRVVIPSLGRAAERVRALCADLPEQPVIVSGGAAERFDAFAAADAALAVSGTVALELAFAGVPSAVAYRTGPVTAAITRRLITGTRFASIVNILLDREAVPEFLQENCTAARIAPMLDRALGDPDVRTAQREAGEAVARMLGRDGEAPSARAARIVLDLAEGGAAG